MKRLLIFMAVTVLCGCHNVKIGYLITENASYDPDVWVIPAEVDPQKYPDHVANNAPWVTNKIEGVLGTQPINYAVAEVKAFDGGDAETFRGELKIRGMGIFEVPLHPASPKGKYVVSIRIYNEDHSHLKEDVITFVIE